jgi:hypothetical protein
MMRVPSMDEIWEVSESRGANSEAPHLWDGLVGAWPMQEGGGSQIYDVSQYRNNGTMVNMALTSWERQQYGRIIRFDGVDDRVDVPYSPILTPSKQLTLSVFAAATYGTLSTANKHIINKGYYSHTDPYYSYALALRDDPSIGMARSVFFAVGAGNVFTAMHVQNVVVYDRVQHYAATYDGSFMRIFVDGALKASMAASGDIPNFNTELMFCKMRNWVDHFSGIVSDIRIWNRALLPEELAQISADPWAMYRVRPRVLVRGVTPKKTPIHHLMAGCT